MGEGESSAPLGLILEYDWDPGYAVLPNGPIFSDFGPESDFFEQNGPELVRITTQKSGLGGNKQRQFNNLLYLRHLD